MVIGIGFLLLLLAPAGLKPNPERAGRWDGRCFANGSGFEKGFACRGFVTQTDFDQLARVYHQGTPYALPHAMFVIDRRDDNKIYYRQLATVPLSQRFSCSRLISIPRGADVFKPVYVDQDRRFIVGTIAWQKTVEKFTWELWEGDLATRRHDQDRRTRSSTRPSFNKVSYKPNSIRQEDVSANIGIDRVLQDELNRNQAYLALNTGTAVGRIHIIDKLDDTVEIGDNEITRA